MNLSRVKTYLIIILVIGNALLAGLFGFRYFSERAADRQTGEQLIALLAERGVIVHTLPGETVPALTLSRDLAAESAAVAALLGETHMADLGGGAFEYQNNVGEARFRSGGRFDIELLDGPFSTDTEQTCRELLSVMGFQNVSADFHEEPVADGGVLLTFRQDIEKRPLYNARASFRFSDRGQLLSVSGLWALGDVQSADSVLCKSAGAALLIFSVERDAEITGIELGYRLRTQTVTAESARLFPEWRIICADEEYYLDGFSGAEAGFEE